MSKLLLPVISAIAAGLALLAHLLWPQWITSDLLMGLVVALPLPGLPELVRALRQRGTATATAEVKIMDGAQLLELVALAQRLLVADHPAVRQAGADLGGLLGQQQREAPSVDIEDALEHAFWRYDRERQQSGDERNAWKKYVRAAFEGQIGVPPAPAPRSTPPALPPAALLILLPFLALASCGSLGTSLKTCAVSAIPAVVTEGVGVALHRGEGWEDALAELVRQYGICLVKAEVGAQANRSAPAVASLVAPPPEGTVDDAEALARARTWLGAH